MKENDLIRQFRVGCIQEHVVSTGPNVQTRQRESRAPGSVVEIAIDAGT